MSGRQARVVGLVAVLVGVGGCAGKGPVEYRPGPVHQDPAGVYAIVLPQGWAQDPDYPYLAPDRESDFPDRDVAFAEQAVLDDPDKDPEYAPKIRVDVDPWGGTLQEAADQKRDLHAAHDPIPVDEVVALPDGTPAHLLTTHFSSIEFRHLLVVNGNTLVTVEVNGYGERWERYRGLYEAALRSVTTPVDAPPPTGAELSGHPAQPGVPFRDDEGAFTIVPPPGWQIGVSPPERPGDRDRRVTFGESDPAALTDRSWIHITATAADDPGTALAERIESARQGFRRPYAYTGDEPTTLAGGTPAQLFADTDGWDRAMLLLATARGELYEVEAGALTPQDWERNQAAIEAAIASFAVS